MKRLLAVAVAAMLSLSLLATSASAASARAALNRVLPDMKFDGVGLSDCIDFLRDVSGANIHVNWKALEEVGVNADTPVNLRLRSVSLATVLSLVLSEAGGGETLAYDVDEGVIEITTADLANRKIYTRVYPVDDLLMEIPDFAGPSMSLQDSNATSGGGNGGSSGGGGIFQDREEDDGDEGKTKAERADDLVSLIKEVIYPDIWEQGTASIRYFNGSLIVSAPRVVHEAIGGPFE